MSNIAHYSVFYVVSRCGHCPTRYTDRASSTLITPGTTKMDKLFKAFNTAAETLRAPVELGALYAWWPWINAQTPASPVAGKPVLILPGLSSGDQIMAPLRRCLDAKGYKSYGWAGGINIGHNDKTAAHLVARLHEVYAAGGNQKVVIIGHSLGGLFARELARDFPDMVESIITLGAPFGMKDTDTPEMLKRVYQFINPTGDLSELSDADLHARRLTPPPGIPATSIYSKADGIVPWRACLNPKTPLTENIAVPTSHVGMPYHPLTVAAVLDRLATPPAAWRPFAAAKYSPLYAWTQAAHSDDLPQNPQWTPGKDSRPIFKKK